MKIGQPIAALLTNLKQQGLLDEMLALWQYQHAGGWSGRAGDPSGELGDAFWYGLTSKDGKAMGVFRTKLPGSDALKVAAGISEDDLFALRPGAQVSIKVDVQAPAAELESIRAGLTATLKKSGFDVGPGSGAVFTASTFTGESFQRTYRGFADQRSETVTITPYISRL